MARQCPDINNHSSHTTLTFSYFENPFDQKKKIFFNLAQISF